MSGGEAVVGGGGANGGIEVRAVTCGIVAERRSRLARRAWCRATTGGGGGGVVRAAEGRGGGGDRAPPEDNDAGCSKGSFRRFVK